MDFEAWWETNRHSDDPYTLAYEAFQAGVIAGKESVMQKMPDENDEIIAAQNYLKEP